MVYLWRQTKVFEDLVKFYHMTHSDAVCAVNQSPLLYLMDKYPDLTMHYPIEGWTDAIWRFLNHMSIDE
jgi:hypothetical protein